MFGTRKTWDLGHAPCLLQELWKQDISLDASALDFLMSDGEEDGSFLSLPASAFPQRTSLSPAHLASLSPAHLASLGPAHLAESRSPHGQTLRVQNLQEKVCEFQARLRGDEVSGVQDRSSTVRDQQGETLDTPPRGVRSAAERLGSQEDGDKLVSQLNTQVEELEEKLLHQSQEGERLRSELGATDLEKHLELLVSENERLKQELRSCRKLLTAQHRLAPPPSPGHAHTQDAEGQRGDLLEESGRQQGAEPRRRRSLRGCEEEFSRQVKYGSQAAEAESCREELEEEQARSAALQEQLALQRTLLRELETQLHESHRTCGQLRTQVTVYEGELQRAQGQLELEVQSLEEEKNRVVEEAFIRAEREMRAVHQNLAGVRVNLLTLQPALRTLTCDYNALKRQVHHFPFLLDQAISQAKQEICQAIGEVSQANQELLRKYKREMNLRKKCHNELVRLKGNIRVLCRVRPVCHGEQDPAEARNMVTFDPEDDAVLYLSNKGKLMTFEMDKVFPSQATQEEVFQEVQSLVTSCIDGYNVCIFAYGQTGSGKTYTMEGVPGDPGINQRALRLLFSEVTEKAPDWNYSISVSMVEIYNETLRNLLGDGPSEKLDIKLNPDGSGQLYVPGLTQVTVQSPEDINQVFDLGHMNRATACTNLNEHSSRSHALLIITVAGLNTSTGLRTHGKLNLVDLAGSERIAKSGAEGSRLREAQCINKSLSALGDVINALRSRHAHVPFRNSRLTYLLQDSLSGESKTLMMVQVSPLVSNMSESVCSLKFAQRVRTIELGCARRQENSSTSSSPTHDSVELDSPPVTPVPIPLSRASSAGSTLSSTSKTPNTRRRSQSQLSTGRLKLTA